MCSQVGNPVVQHGRLAGPVSALSEIHMHYEHPFRFVYHTLRWLSVRLAPNAMLL